MHSCVHSIHSIHTRCIHTIPAHTCTCNTQLYTAYSLRVIEDVTYVLHLFRLCPIASTLLFSYLVSLTAFML